MTGFSQYISVNVVCQLLLLLTTVNKQNEQHRLKIWLRCTLQPTHNEATSEWIKLHTDEFHKLFCTSNTVVVVINAQKISLRKVSER